MDLSRKWAFVEDDPDLDEEGHAAFAEASEMREQANALAHHSKGKEPLDRLKCLREAVSMYCRAGELLTGRLRNASMPAQELALQCRLNAACLALETASIPAPGAEGRKQAEQAEKSSESLAKEALDLDPKNPHAALLLARLSADKRDPAALRWLSQAKVWALERNDQEAQKQVQCLESNLYPKPSSWGKEPSDWVRLAVQLLKQGKPSEAKHLFLKTIDFLEEDGALEGLQPRAIRALGFDALEGLAESLAAMNDFAGALETGRRAASLLEPTRPGMQVPFPEPECSRRQGLLYLSMAHATEGLGKQDSSTDALRFFRLAAQALQRHGQDPALEGNAVLEWGLRLAKECEEGNLESADLAVPALEHATSCLKTAQGRCVKRPSSSGQGSEEVARKLRWRELQAQVALCSVHSLRGDVEDVQDDLDASKHLLPKVGDMGDSPTHAALERAELCGQWAFLAAKVGRLGDAEEALLLKWHLAGGKDKEQMENANGESMRADGEGKDLSPFQKRCTKLQQEALQSLALVKQKAQNSAGVQDVMSLLERVPGSLDTTQEMKRHLQRGTAQKEPALEVSKLIQKCTKSAFQRGASLVVLVACLVSLLMSKPSSWDGQNVTAS